MDYPKSVPGVGLVNGKFVDENTATGQVGSLIPCSWGNAITDELLNVIRAGGEEPVEGEHDQLVAAIRAIVLDTIPEEEIRTTLDAYGITDAYTKDVTYTKTEIEDRLKNLSELPVDVADLALEVQRLRGLTITTTHKKLSVSTTGTSSIVTLKAEKLIIGGDGAAQAVKNIDLSLNMLAVGLGGLDAGVVAASSCYGVWVATNGEAVAATAALMPILQGATTLGSPIITGLPSTASMRVGMQFSSAVFPWGVTIKSIDSANKITANQSALATVAVDNLRFVYEPVLPVGYVASRFSAFFTDSSASKFPLAYAQWNRLVRLRPAAGTNVATLPSLAGGGQGNPSHSPVFVPVALGAFVPPTALKISLTIYGYLTNSSVIAAPNPGHYGLTSTPISASPLHLSQGSTAGGTHVATSGEMVPERGYIYYASNAGNTGLVLGGWEDDV